MLLFLSSLLCPADACSIIDTKEHVVDADSTDVVRPGAVTAVAVVDINRGHGPDCDEDGLCMSTSCDEIGTMTLQFDTALDDQTDELEMGYLLDVVSGMPPIDFVVPVDAIRAPDGQITLSWQDGDTVVQEAFSFELSITAVDLAGNEGSPSFVQVSHGGRAIPDDVAASAGCSSSGALRGAVALWLVMPLVAYRRR
ncbi:MAG: hypothetical protein AAFV53_27995 [Myxococcota bacterium]